MTWPVNYHQGDKNSMECSMPTIPIREWIEALGTFYDQYGYLVVFLGTLSENTALLGLVLPGNSLALLGAFYAREGTLNLGWVIFLAWLGTVLGYHADYLLGRFVLLHVMARWSKSRLGQRLRLAGRIRLARMMLAKYGGKAILLSHTIGHMRSFVALTAGITHMKYLHFLFFEAIAALLWNTVFCLLGYMIAGEIERVQAIIERSGWVMLAVFVLLFLVWRWWKRKKTTYTRQRRKAVPG
jgi:membrane protein DedA with SNARE-associated domain